MSIHPMPRKWFWSPPESVVPPKAPNAPKRSDAEALRAALHEAGSEIAALEKEADEERARADELERLLHTIKREYEIFKTRITDLGLVSGATNSNSDYATVGLHESAPDFLIRAARRAHRAANHPDTKAPREKAAAEAAFKANEAVFDRLFRLRGMTA